MKGFQLNTYGNKRLIHFLKITQGKVYADARGTFRELYKNNSEDGHEISRFSQINTSKSLKGVTRGIHFQMDPHQQAKLVTCISGTVMDVVVDLRINSEHFGEWFGLELRAADATSLWIPEGFGHAFQALEDDSILTYGVTKPYSPTSEVSINPADETIAIVWPIEPSLLSEKDASGISLKECYTLLSR